MSEGKYPEARLDGKCIDCVDRQAETFDRRFCRKCLKWRINHETPIFDPYNRTRRYAEPGSKYEAGETSPWHENAVRNLEDA